jgi:small subunit ribosomal protein S17
MAEEQTPDNAEETAAATRAETAAEAPETAGAPETRDATEAAATSAPAPAAEPEEVLAPKERRRRARAARAAKTKARAARTPEERHAERVADRGKKAQLRRTARTKATAKHKAEAHSRTATPPREHVVGQQKVRQGVVVSDKADKTITVRIDTARRHRRYSKIVRTSQNLHAHDESNDAHIGDTVIVREARPLSRTKRWRLIQVVERAK